MPGCAGSNRDVLIDKWANDLADVVSENCGNRRITETGCELVARFPFEEKLLN